MSANVTKAASVVQRRVSWEETHEEEIEIKRRPRILAEGPGWGHSTTLSESGALDLLELVRPEWWNRAACRLADPNIEFFQPEGSHNRYASDAAREVCAKCPVWDHCYREHVVERCEPEGVWAGFTRKTAQAERRRLGIKLTRWGEE